jgi:hypothetical protein
MSIGHKYSNIQVFRLMIYQRALHPELFDLQERRMHRHGEYEVETWLCPAGHVVRFQVGHDCLTETVIEHGDHLPETGLVHALPCLGEKDYELARDTSPRLGYVTTVQTENLAENLYVATYRELRDNADEEDRGVCHEWLDADGAACMSILDVQKYRKEFHTQSYHLLGASGVVLRTQSIFEVRG